jgi:hypothetical protein
MKTLVIDPRRTETCDPPISSRAEARSDVVLFNACWRAAAARSRAAPVERHTTGLELH